MPDEVTTYASRYSVFVPSPKARINLGKPDLDAPFGYTGMSLQSDVHFLLDVNKVALMQSGSHACWQVGGKWLQWSNSHMFMASTANTFVGADNKLTLVAGAGQGQITALDHGLGHVTPRVVDYNNLELHYRVEELHNGLKAFFYGDGWKTKQYTPPAAQLLDYTGAYPAGSFLKRYHEQLVELGTPVLEKRALLQPLEWEGGYLDMTMKPSSVFPALRAYDPYPAVGFSGPWTMAYAGFVQVVNWLHRLVDVLKKVGPAITDNTIGKRVQAVISAWGNAQEGINAALNFADLWRYDRDTGKSADDPKKGLGAWQDEWANVVARLPASHATLETGAGPWDITNASDLTLKLRDTKNGSQTTIDLSDLLVRSPAQIQLTIAVLTTKVGVSGAANGDTLTLDGTVVTYASDTWGALPAGFQWSGGSVARANAAPFTAATTGSAALSDQTFSASDTVTVIVDGTPATVALTSVNDLTAAGRATKLAAAIGASASASNTQVTLSSTVTGPTGRVAWDTSPLVAQKLGCVHSATAVGSSSGTVTADQLKAKLEGHGNYDTSVTAGTTVTLTHKVLGDGSYLDVSQPLATTFFGANPTSDEGKNKLSTEASFKNLSNMRSLQWEMSKWPEDLRNQTRPLYEAVGDLAAVVDRAKAIVDDAITFITGGLSPPSTAGLLAKDAITLGTTGGLYGVAKSITLVSSPAAEPDDAKFIPGLEKLVKWLLDANWEACKGMQESFKAAPGKPLKGAPGVRIVSSTDLVAVASGEARLQALTRARVEGALVAVTASSGVTVASRVGSVSIQGKQVRIGNAAHEDALNQEATAWVNVRADESVELMTSKLRAVLDGDDIAVGKLGVAAKQVDDTKPRLLVNTAAGAEAATLGFASGGNVSGFKVEHDGKIGVLGTQLKLGVANSAGVTVTSADVQIAGTFKVGTALLVKGDGMFTLAPVAPTLALVAPRLIAIPTEYTALMTPVRADKLLLEAARAALLLMQGQLAAMPVSPASLIVRYNLRTHIDDAEEDVQDQLEALQAQKPAWRLLVDEGRQYGMTDTEIGLLPTDEQCFE